MIFVDYVGPGERFAEVRPQVLQHVSAVLKVPETLVVVRRIVTEGGGDEIELWIELSSEEQVYRLGPSLAKQIAEALRPNGSGPSVWVMYRIVPLRHAFLNGSARGRGTPVFE